MKLKNKQPLVSVIIPVYNAGQFLGAALDSILNQTYKNLEIVAIDDASTDNSWSLLKHYATRDSRLKIFRNPKNRKISYTLNRAIKKARGQFIARMDADDIAYKNRIKQQISYLLKHPDTVIVGGQCRTIDIDNKLIGVKKFPTTDQSIRNAMYTLNPLQHPTVIINRSLLPKNFSWYKKNLPPAEDLDLFFRLGKYGKYHNLNSFVLKYRQYAGSQTFKNPLLTFSKTKIVRHLAITQYGYQPTIKAQVLNLIQNLTLAILPPTLVYPLYTYIRGIHSPLHYISEKLIKPIALFFTNLKPAINKQPA